MNNPKIKILILVILDAVLVNVSSIASLLLRFEFSTESASFQSFFQNLVSGLAICTIIKLLVFFAASLYTSLWRYASTEEMLKIVVACVASSALCVTYRVLFNLTLPRSVYVISLLLDIILVACSRFGYRWLRDAKTPGSFNLEKDHTGELRRILLVGAGDAGASLIKEIKLHKEQMQKVVVVVDDNPAKVGQRILGVKIEGSRGDIPKLVRKYQVDEIVIAIPSASKKQIREIIEICHKTRCKVRTLPSLIDLLTDKVSVSALRDINIEDLLGRDPVSVDLREISGYLEGKIVLVTGAGGSIGSELCRQIARFRPRRLVLLDIYENGVFDLGTELKAKFPGLEYNITIGSVADLARMEEIFAEYKPHVVFHAAAHKHVPLMEFSPREAVANNVIGTKNCLDLAEKYRAGRFVLISTDKAVNPSSVMGATKRICEMLLQEKSKTQSVTNFSAVRFGNVLGSNGSVIPTFRRQIAAGGPVTVTDKEMTRFFMTIPEAVQLVVQAGAMAKGGEIFVLDMGEPVKILDLAENLIRLSGFVPYEEIDIEFTGLRPGEKLYEELLLNGENTAKTSHDKIYIGRPLPASESLTALLQGGQLELSIEGLKNKKDGEIRKWIKEMVPNYTGLKE